MSRITVSASGRVYERAFDHDEARELRAASWSYNMLAEHFGVSAAAVRRACDPSARAYSDKKIDQWIRDHRQPCKGGCGRLVWHAAKRSGFCVSCLAIARSAANERPGELRCVTCGLWKPDDAFRAAKRASRRGRQGRCRDCETEARRDHRRRNYVHEQAVWRAQYDRKRGGGEMAEYLVLYRNKDGAWEERGREIAPTRERAIEAVADTEGTWAAVTVGQFVALDVAMTRALRVVPERARDAVDALTATERR